jgi:hypothetical protein
VRRRLCTGLRAAAAAYQLVTSPNTPFENKSFLKEQKGAVRQSQPPPCPPAQTLLSWTTPLLKMPSFLA